MRKYSFFFLIIILFGIFEQTALAASGGEHAGKIQACIEANKKGKSKSIEDYVCPGGRWSPQEIAYQVILDLEFHKIDKEVEKDLKTLQAKSTKDIGKLDTTISNWFDSTSKEPKYRPQYMKICEDLTDKKSVLGQAIEFFSGSISTDQNTKSFISGQTECSTLVGKKLTAYKSTAWLLAESAVVKSYKKDKHDYMIELKDNYQKFLDKWMIYIGQLAVIKDKWPSKTKIVQ